MKRTETGPSSAAMTAPTWPSIIPSIAIAGACMAAPLFQPPTHEYLDFGAGTDSKERLWSRSGRPSCLRKELMKPSWKGEHMSFRLPLTPYVPLEANYKLTSGPSGSCAEFRKPGGHRHQVRAVRRDIDHLQSFPATPSLGVYFHIPFDDYEIARALETFCAFAECAFAP
jgi:DNA repair photolyase